MSNSAQIVVTPQKQQLSVHLVILVYIGAINAKIRIATIVLVGIRFARNVVQDRAIKQLGWL